MGVRAHCGPTRWAACTFGVVLLVAQPVRAGDHEQEILDWRQARLEELIAEDGWLSVVGLYWLEEGTTTFGTDHSVDIVFPPGAAAGSAPQSFFGSVEVLDGRAWVRPAPGQQILVDGVSIGGMELLTDQHENTTVLEIPPYRFFLIERQGRLGLRLKDLTRPATLPAPEIGHFPIRRHWRITARLEAYDPPKTIPIPTVLGTINQSTSPGELVFEIADQEVRLDPILSGERLFVIFADQTTGRETYGGGRYLYTSPADATGRVLLDFNKAHNPPCVFTDYATCFLPPRQNRLPVLVDAGEKMVEGYSVH